MKCTACDFENAELDQYCRKCGTLLTSICPKCGAESLLEDAFCGKCGYPLAANKGALSKNPAYDEKLNRLQRYLPAGIIEKILSQKEKLEGERRQVSVMFCDMVGFTSFSERQSPETVYRIMDDLFEILIRKVHEYGGIVNKMTGDGIMALFGAPIALENGPQRAIHSALAIHREIKKFSEKIRQKDKGIAPFSMRIGIHTGMVVVGTIGSNLRVEFTAVGDTVNLASRMETMADPGTTYVTESTYQLSKTLFRFEPLGKKMVKGKKTAILVYMVISELPHSHKPRLGHERLIYSEMVGRKKELNTLELQVMKVVNGQGSVVSIIGEAGIGKSRLVAELMQRDIIKRVTLLEGRAISIGRNLSFHPIIDLLKHWAQISAVDTRTTALMRLETAIQRLCPEDARDVFPFVATLMGMKPFGKYAERIKGIEGDALEKMIVKSLRQLLIRLSEKKPLIIVLEDLHWADTSSIEIMELLFRLADTCPIFFIILFRTGYADTGDKLVEALKERLSVYYVEVLLEPLGEQTSVSLITNMLKNRTINHAFIGKIVPRAGGNPFFIEEVVRSLIDNEAIIVKEGKFEVTEKIDRMTIPYTINDLLMARIDKLDEKTRTLVRQASVIGRNFFYRVLLEVAESIDNIDNMLSNLKTFQMILERKRMGELEYFFKHTLAQEVAYDSILPKKQKALHLKVAASIEKVFLERLHEFFGMLAYHYSRAENLEKTEKYLLKAGEEALKSSASKEALHYYQEALRLYIKTYGEAATPEKVALLEKNIALTLYNRGEYDEAVKHFDSALSYYWTNLPKNSISTLFKFFSSFFSFITALYLPFMGFRKTPTETDIEVINLYFKKCQALVIINPKRFFFESFYLLKKIVKFDLEKLESGIEIIVGTSGLFSFTGISFGLSRKTLKFAVKRIDRSNDKALILYDFLKTTHHYFKGDWDKIESHRDDLVKKNLDIGEIYKSSQYLYWHGCPLIYQGAFKNARLIVSSLEEIIDVYGNDLSILLKYKLNINFLLERRKLHDAKKEAMDGIRFAQKKGFDMTLIDMYACLARAHIFSGDMDKAITCLTRAEKIKIGVNAMPIQISNYYLSWFEYYLFLMKDKTKSPTMSTHAGQALKSGKRLIKNTRKAAQHRPTSYLLMGSYYWLLDKQRKAYKWWTRAIREAEIMGARLELWRAYREIGNHLREEKSRGNHLNEFNADEYLNKAQVLGREMGLP